MGGFKVFFWVKDIGGKCPEKFGGGTDKQTDGQTDKGMDEPMDRRMGGGGHLSHITCQCSAMQ